MRIFLRSEIMIKLFNGMFYILKLLMPNKECKYGLNCREKSCRFNHPMDMKKIEKISRLSNLSNIFKIKSGEKSFIINLKPFASDINSVLHPNKTFTVKRTINRPDYSSSITTKYNIDLKTCAIQSETLIFDTYTQHKTENSKTSNFIPIKPTDLSKNNYEIIAKKKCPEIYLTEIQGGHYLEDYTQWNFVDDDMSNSDSISDDEKFEIFPPNLYDIFLQSPLQIIDDQL